MRVRTMWRATIAHGRFLLNEQAMCDVTRILGKIEAGDPSAAEQLLPLVYEELMNARRRAAEKRGGGRARIELDPTLLPATDRDERLLALDEALIRLEQQHPEKARLVKLRFFAGLTIADAAAAMGISDTTADRYWAYARAWLQREVAAAGGSGSD